MFFSISYLVDIIFYFIFYYVVPDLKSLFSSIILLVLKMNGLQKNGLIFMIFLLLLILLSFLTLIGLFVFD